MPKQDQIESSEIEEFFEGDLGMVYEALCFREIDGHEFSEVQLRRYLRKLLRREARKEELLKKRTDQQWLEMRQITTLLGTLK